MLILDDRFLIKYDLTPPTPEGVVDNNECEGSKPVVLSTLQIVISNFISNALKHQVLENAK